MWDIAPAADVITQRYGCTDYSREFPCPGCPGGYFHAGIDLGSSAGGWSIFRSPVYATRPGVVADIGIVYLGDQAVALRLDDGMYLLYGHLDAATVKTGDRVVPGTQVGLLGTKGSSSAPHLHVEARVDGPFQGVDGCPQNDATRDSTDYLVYVAPDETIGLDSSTPPTVAQVAVARAAGVRVWSGYLALPGGGRNLLNAWLRADFDAARRCGGTPIAYCSGWDDPVALKALAAAWGVRLCLDDESGIRDDGPWVQPFLDASGAGLYGPWWVHEGRRAAFHILAAYPSLGDPFGDSWWGQTPRPRGAPCGWQWAGSHQQFGAEVDSTWFDAWFATAQGDLDMQLIRAIGDANAQDPHGANAQYIVSAQQAPDGTWIPNPTAQKRHIKSSLEEGDYLALPLITVRQSLLDRVQDGPEIVSGAYPVDNPDAEAAGIAALLTRPPIDVAALAAALAPHIQAVDEAKLEADLLDKLPAADAAAVLAAFKAQLGKP